MSRNREEEIAELQAKIEALRGDAATRLDEIKSEINKLLREGMTLADSAGVKFYLSDSPIAENYGMGGLRYIPEDAAETTYYNGTRTGWVSSSSDDC